MKNAVLCVYGQLCLTAPLPFNVDGGEVLSYLKYLSLCPCRLSSNAADNKIAMLLRRHISNHKLGFLTLHQWE